ncbi:MAG: hypothetical protein BZ138_05900 [Methanosphaera sp. rholeuAM270]|nr:MAG: hypothetical protein BZ138_05900 [Methanosphaera sp. rholeuAM270]
MNTSMMREYIAKSYKFEADPENMELLNELKQLKMEIQKQLLREAKHDQNIVQENLVDYLESTGVDDNMEYIHTYHLELLKEMEKRLSNELEAVRYAIQKCTE